jgi:hypothetical protein
MNVILDQTDLINLIKGCSPAYCHFDDLKGLGRYNDNTGWTWNTHVLKDLDNSELYELYVNIK